MVDTTYTGQQIVVAVKASGPAYTDAAKAGNNVSFSLDRSLRELYELGSKDPFAIKEANIRIRGHIEKKFSVDNFSASGKPFCKLAGAHTADSLDEMELAIFPAGIATPSILLTGVKFSNYELSSDQEGDVIESCDYAGLTSVVTVS